MGGGGGGICPGISGDNKHTILCYTCFWTNFCFLTHRKKNRIPETSTRSSIRTPKIHVFEPNLGTCSIRNKQELQEVGKFPIEIFWNIATWNFDIISFISKKFGLWKPELKETEL